MKISRVEWLLAAKKNPSLRRKMGLVLLILASPETTDEERDLALRLETLLYDIAGLAIAPASRLRRFRLRFAVLCEMVEKNTIPAVATHG